MGIESYITDSGNHKKAHITTHNDKGYHNGIVVATEPLRKWENQGKTFFSPSFGIDMNISIPIVFTENIHNGIDDIYWTATSITGVIWFPSSVDQAHTGNFSIKYDKGASGDILQIDKGTDLNLIDFDTLSIWIYVDKDWDVGDSIVVYGWDTTTGVVIGEKVPLENYFNSNIFDIWQKISIPLSAMNLSGKTLDSIRIENASVSGKSPKIYLDDIQFTGVDAKNGSGEFTIEPDKGTWYYIDNIRFILADDITGKVENGTMVGLAYDKLLGLSSLSSGILYQKLKFREIETTFTLHQLSDMLSTPNSSFQTVSDGINTLLIVDLPFTKPLILRAEEQDKIKLVISDDLSELILFRAFVGGWKEDRQ